MLLRAGWQEAEGGLTCPRLARIHSSTWHRRGGGSPGTATGVTAEPVPQLPEAPPPTRGGVSSHHLNLIEAEDDTLAPGRWDLF